MKSFYEYADFMTIDEVLLFFQKAIEYREEHKNESEKIARFVFDATHVSRLKLSLPYDLEQIRYEFGALEAPGRPQDDIDLSLFVDQLWNRLQSIIEKAGKEKRTV